MSVHLNILLDNKNGMIEAKNVGVLPYLIFPNLDKLGYTILTSIEVQFVLLMFNIYGKLS